MAALTTGESNGLETLNQIQVTNTKKTKKLKKNEMIENESDGDDCVGDESRSDDGSDNGSDLVDFIVDGDDDSEACEEDDMNDDSGMDRNNIVTGKRTRKAPVRYIETYGLEDHRQAMLGDIVAEELEAAVYGSVSDDESEECSDSNDESDDTDSANNTDDDEQSKK